MLFAAVSASQKLLLLVVARLIRHVSTIKDVEELFV